MKPQFLMMAVFATVASLSAAPPEIRKVTAMPSATMRQLAKNPRAALVNRHRHEEREARVTTAREASASVIVATPPGAGTVAAPPATAGFRAAYDRFIMYPSDASGAVGKTQILGVTNSEYTVHDRSGNRLFTIDPEQFWADPAAPAGDYFDARAIYDRRNDRFIIAALFDVSFRKGEVLIAVSQSGDATGAWSRFRFRVNPTLDSWDGDFTRLGITRDALVVSTNIFGGSASLGAFVYVAQLKDLASSPATLSIATYKFGGPDYVPVTSYDDATVYVARASSDFLQVDVLSAGGNQEIAEIQAPTRFTFTGTMRVGNQLGLSARVDCGLPILHTATLRNGMLWAVESGYLTSPLRASVRWWKFNVASPATTAQSALIDDPTGARSFAFPSIAVNAAGAALVGYSWFSPDVFPAAGYTYIDPLGRISTQTVLKTGDTFYTIDRWADYSETTVDPVNDNDFWTVQTFSTALLPNDTRPRWATWFGKITVAAARGRVARK